MGLFIAISLEGAVMNAIALFKWYLIHSLSVFSLQTFIPYISSYKSGIYSLPSTIYTSFSIPFKHLHGSYNYTMSSSSSVVSYIS